MSTGLLTKNVMCLLFLIEGVMFLLFQSKSDNYACMVSDYVVIIIVLTHHNIKHNNIHIDVDACCIALLH